MNEKLIRELIEKIEEKAYIPNDWVGVSEVKIIKLKDVMSIIDEYKPKDKFLW